MFRIEKSWNPVLNFVVSVKCDYIEKYGKENLYEAGKESTCLDRWVKELDNQMYKDIIKYLKTTQCKNLVLLHYENLYVLYEGVLNERKENPNAEEIWDKYDGFYNEARSVTVNVEKEELVLTPFRKFRNLDECDETATEKIQERINKAECIEFSNKLDGSMQAARFYNEKVVMSGSQSLNKETSWRLEDGYRMLSEYPHAVEMLMDYPDKTFIFEYISKKDAHVVVYTKSQEGLYLIGIRDVETGKESSYKQVMYMAQTYGIKTTEIFNTSLDEVVSSLDKKKSYEAEGFVLNVDGYKVKIKYNDYLKVNKLIKTLISPNEIITAISNDVFDDYIAKIPANYKTMVMEDANKVFLYMKMVEDRVNALYEKAPKGSKKDFMLWCNDTTNVPSILCSYVRCRYNGQKYNPLQSGQRTHKMYEIESRIEKMQEQEMLDITENIINFC